MSTKISNTNSNSESDDIQTLARLAGLERAMLRFPEDVNTAARTALKIRASLSLPIDNTAEAWPVMQVKS
ncbi:hypothetical protein MCEGE14_01007 [Burkholderiaceae bacterium]